MAGTRRLVCRGFIEAASFETSKQILRDELAERGDFLTDRELDARMETMQWALNRGDMENIAPVGRRNLWVYVLPVGDPPIRFYLRQRPEQRDECEILWIEERLL